MLAPFESSGDAPRSRDAVTGAPWHGGREARVSRRRFLGGAAAAWGAMTLRSAIAETESKRPGVQGPGEQPVIDAHSHVWTPDVRAFPLAEGLSVEDLKPRSFLPEELLAIARPQGVRRVVLIQHTIYHRTDNSYIVDCIRRFPGVFSGVATIDESAPDVAYQMRLLQAAGVRGFRIVPVDWRTGRRNLSPEEWLARPGMRTMWQVAADRGLAICPLIDPQYLPAVDAMCERFPHTTVVIDHFGRVGIDGQVRAADVKHLCRLARHRHTYVKVSAFYALGQKRPPYRDLLALLRAVYDAFGPRRLMWGSDSPYQLEPPHTYAASLRVIRELAAFLSAEDREWILRRTAASVFFPEA